MKWNWVNMGEQFPDYEEAQYINHYRMTKGTFQFLCERYGKMLKKQTTRLRQPIPYPKRLAIVIHWMAHCLTFTQLAALYAIAKSTAIAIVHEGITVLHKELVPESIRLPTGSEFDQVMYDFKSLCGLLLCAGALDGTFMRIRKPSVFGDTYYCYKRFTAIIVLGCVDARGVFTYVNSGRPGSVGDSYTFRHCLLGKKIRDKEWLNNDPKRIEGVDVQPYIVADSAFRLSSSVMKCFDESHGRLSRRKRSFNYALIRTRRVVEQAFGRLKGRWKIMDGCNLNDPTFASRVAVVCCALHNVCERYQCPFESSWLPNSSAYTDGGATTSQQSPSVQSALIRDALSKYVHRTHLTNIRLIVTHNQ